MALNIPDRWEPQIEQIAQSQHISTDEALDRILEAGFEKLQTPVCDAPRVSYASLFGSAKSGYGSREEVDRAIAEMRDEW